MLCDKAREILADTSARFGHFHEVLLAMEGRADANRLAAEILLLRAIRSRNDRILQNAGLNHLLTIAVLCDRLLLPGAGIAPEIIKGDEDALRLLKPTGSDPFGGSNAPKSRDGGHPAHIPSVRGSILAGGSAPLCSHPGPVRVDRHNAMKSNGNPAGY